MVYLVISRKTAHGPNKCINPIVLWLRVLKQELLATFFAHDSLVAIMIKTPRTGVVQDSWRNFLMWYRIV